LLLIPSWHGPGPGPLRTPCAGAAGPSAVGPGGPSTGRPEGRLRGPSTWAEKPAQGKRCCFDDITFEAGYTATGLFCKAGEWVRPGSFCTVKNKDGQTEASIKCGHPVKTNGKFEVSCSSAKGKFSTSYSDCDGASTGGATTGSATTGSATTYAVPQVGTVQILI